MNGHDSWRPRKRNGGTWIKVGGRPGSATRLFESISCSCTSTDHWPSCSCSPTFVGWAALPLGSTTADQQGSSASDLATELLRGALHHRRGNGLCDRPHIANILVSLQAASCARRGLRHGPYRPEPFDPLSDRLGGHSVAVPGKTPAPKIPALRGDNGSVCCWVDPGKRRPEAMAKVRSWRVSLHDNVEGEANHTPFGQHQTSMVTSGFIYQSNTSALSTTEH